ncbi:TIGR02206 family membrane protein [Brachybacterium sp. J144]|uniref:YwaF family protein n=1 Tax=Brachybacterium sp. J144 TaxID=3116487 RepID=UPI002E7A5EA4|nr:TIGR02206 family membrane protein [Brachybacterium sp. J144]MEE1652043.1 TIGR02206 family membrane protein [Brachybacterium sp. J144]
MTGTDPDPHGTLDLLADGLIGHMPAYGATHLAMLVLLVVAAVSLVQLVRRTPPAATDRVLRIVGWALLANSTFWTLWGFMPWAWNLDESLPLHFSDALRFLVPLALITRAPWAIVVTWYWGLTLNMQSVLTPDLNYFVWVPLEFSQYWIAHGAGLLAPVVLCWGLGYRPTWRGYGAAYATTLAWAAIAATGNTLTGANYGYLNRAPAGPSILDLLGPWPQYLLVEAVLIAAVWAAMTLPWVLLDRRAGTPPSGRGGLLRRAAPPGRGSAVPGLP